MPDDLPPGYKPVFGIAMNAKGDWTVHATLPLPMLSVLLQQINLNILQGKWQAEPTSPIVPASNGDLAALKNRMPTP